MPKNVFIYGLSGSGKDTIGDYLRDTFGYAKLRIARTIKQIICEKYDLTFDELEELKRTDPKFRLAHHEVSAMLGNKESSMIRLKQLIGGRSADFEYVDRSKPRCIFDVRDFEESLMCLQSGYVGLFLSRQTGEFKDNSHYTEQFMFANGDLLKLMSDDYPFFGNNQIQIIQNNSNLNLNVPVHGLNHFTNGTKVELLNLVSLLKAQNII